MPKFRLTFEVIETNECTIDIEAESPEAAKKAWEEDYLMFPDHTV